MLSLLYYFLTILNFLWTVNPLELIFMGYTWNDFRI
uniref:Uncharacterized protein n=1 Tax=Rhizophora mucronata TaxID=61149 RepID=A0A2P2QFA8_RHIMU